MQQAVDHVSTRVSLAGVTGALAGSLTALYRGHHSLLRTAGLTSFSCAMAATACFGSERLAYTAARSYLLRPEESNIAKQKYLSLATHAIGGLVGGAWVGALYIGRPLRGAFFFTPIMMVIATAEGQFAQMRHSKQMELQQQESSPRQGDNNEKDGKSTV
jgi:hypothetical protein